MTTNNFTPIEWQKNNVEFSEIFKIINPDLLKNLFARGKLRTYLGKRDDTFFMLVSTNEDIEHKEEYSTLMPKSILSSVKVAGHLSQINQNSGTFYLSATSLYKLHYLRRDQSLKWMEKNLPSWNKKPEHHRGQTRSFFN